MIRYALLTTALFLGAGYVLGTYVVSLFAQALIGV